MMCRCPQFTGHQPTKEICKEGFARKILQASVFSRGLLKSPNPTGCFPPKPPARLLMHSDHRSPAESQQEYRGNQWEGLFACSMPMRWNRIKCRDCDDWVGNKP